MTTTTFDPTVGPLLAPEHLPGGNDAPRVDDVHAAAYTIPTEHPEADGTFAWGSTTIVVVHVRAGGGLSSTASSVVGVASSWMLRLRRSRRCGRRWSPPTPPGSPSDQQYMWIFPPMIMTFMCFMMFMFVMIVMCFMI